MSDYDENKPLAELQAMKQTLATMQDAFCDADGLPIDLGFPVRYIREPEEGDSETTPWTPERWGIVTGMTRGTYKGEEQKHVRVETPYVNDGNAGDWYRNEEWFTQPESLRVIQ